MVVKRIWILLPLIPAALVLAALCLLWLTSGAIWNIILVFALFLLFLPCAVVTSSKLRCPACGEPLCGIGVRYLFRHEREIYCPGCGQRVEIVK